MSETVVIINPASGPGGGGIEQRTRYRTSLARQTLDRLGVPHCIELTRQRDHAKSLARAAVAAKAPLVFAWGGDGTMNEIGSELAFSTTALAMIPGGSGNGFARSLGFSLNPRRAIEQAVRGQERLIDAGEIAGRLFFNVAGIGFDAHVSRLFNERGLKRGFFAYITTSFVELLGYRAASYALDIGNGETVKRDAMMVVVANSPQYGNGAQIAPHARPDDGHLDLVVVPSGSPLTNMWRARRLFDGQLRRVPGVILRDVETMRISNGANGTAAANGVLWFHADGEVVEGQAPLIVRIHPQALRVRVPAS